MRNGAGQLLRGRRSDRKWQAGSRGFLSPDKKRMCFCRSYDQQCINASHSSSFFSLRNIYSRGFAGPQDVLQLFYPGEGSHDEDVTSKRSEPEVHLSKFCIWLSKTVLVSWFNGRPSSFLSRVCSRASFRGVSRHLVRSLLVSVHWSFSFLHFSPIAPLDKKTVLHSRMHALHSLRTELGPLYLTSFIPINTNNAFQSTHPQDPTPLNTASS